MKVAVVGAGAMGCLYGGMLSQAGEYVWLIDIWEDHVQALNNHGLAIESDEGILGIPVKATTQVSEVGNVDLVLVFVKSTHTRPALSLAHPLVGPDTVFLTLQNGLGNHTVLADLWGEERVLAGTSSFGATLLGPGRIRLAGKGKTHFGELDGQPSPRMDTLVNVFSKAQLNPSASDNALGLIWDKLMVNVGINALTAIANIANGQLLEIPALTVLLEKSVAEAMQVAEAAGVKLSPDPIGRTKDIARLTGDNVSSMRQDLSHGRTTEIEVINGAIVRLGRQFGIPTPVNETLTQLIHALTDIKQPSS